MPKVSVIVPVYNTEKYLPRCIDSILAQTFTDFELVLINDGSKDNSGKICDDYAKKDNRIIVIHKENEGVSSARNKGIYIAKGDWISFIDSDDTIPLDYLSKFTYDCDFHLCAIKLFGAINRIISPDDKQIEQHNIIQFIIDNYDQLYFSSIGAKIFKTNIIHNNNLSFCSKLKFGEDTHFVYNYLLFCNKIALHSKISYNYYIPDNIITNNKYSLTTDEYYSHVKFLNESITKLEKKFGITFSYLKKRIFNIYLVSYYEYINSLQYHKLKAEMRKYNYYKLIKYSKYLSFKEYIYIRAISIFPFLHTIYKKLKNNL